MLSSQKGVCAEGRNIAWCSAVRDLLQLRFSVRAAFCGQQGAPHFTLWGAPFADVGNGMLLEAGVLFSVAGCPGTQGTDNNLMFHQTCGERPNPSTLTVTALTVAEEHGEPCLFFFSHRMDTMPNFAEGPKMTATRVRGKQCTARARFEYETHSSPVPELRSDRKRQRSPRREKWKDTLPNN